jgi:lipopolysaccharide export LptBFGC system permease protein LptF
MQLKATVFISISIFCLILLFDFAEVTRKYPISCAEETLFSIKLSLLRAPSTFCEILHYVYFVSATFSLWDLCQSHQLTILKSVGKSPQQILYPFGSFAIFMAAAWLFAFHPIGLFSEAQYHKNISPHIFTGTNHYFFIYCQKNDRVISIKTIHKNKQIEGLSIFNTKDNTKIFAQHASIAKNIWILKNVTITSNGEIKNMDEMELVSEISLDLIRLLSQPSYKQNIYYLYKVYRIQRKNGVPLKSYEMELHKLLANCFSFFLFALAAAVICFPINRYKTKTDIAIKVISTAVFLRFANNILESFAHGGIISAQFACWAVPLILTCVLVAILIWKEV